MERSIDILILEHKLIDRMLNVLHKKVEQIKETQTLDPLFIDTAADFFETYVDRSHHDKEERIYFKELEDKNLSSEHKDIMKRLLKEHALARETVGKIIEAKQRYISGDNTGLEDVLNYLELFIQTYPPHIKIEDEKFFIETINYFTADEQISLLEKFNQQDWQGTMQQYTVIIENFEQSI